MKIDEESLKKPKLIEVGSAYRFDLTSIIGDAYNEKDAQRSMWMILVLNHLQGTLLFTRRWLNNTRGYLRLGTTAHVPKKIKGYVVGRSTPSSSMTPEVTLDSIRELITEQLAPILQSL